MFKTPMEHLRTQLDRLDLLIHREILRLRAAYQLSLDEFRGLYISDEQVDQLVNQTVAQNPNADNMTVRDLTRRAAEMHKETAARLPPDFPWSRLVDRFGLTPLEQDSLVYSAAPAFERKYEVLYAYLNNDVTQKSPTVDLATRLFCASSAEVPLLRAALLSSGTLLKSGLLELIGGAAERSALLSTSFAIAPAAANYLLGLSPEDLRMAGWSSFEALQSRDPWPPLGRDLKSRLKRVPDLFQNSGPAPLLVFEGQSGCGRRTAARAICSRMGIPCLSVNLSAIAGQEASYGFAPGGSFRAATLHANLTGCAIYLEQGELLLGSDGNMHGVRAWLETLLELNQPVFLALPPGISWHFAPKGTSVLTFSFETLAFEERRELWAEVSAAHGHRLSETSLAALADRFILTPRQIQAAFRTSVDLAALSGIARADVSFETLLEGARLQAGSSIGRLAMKVNLIHTWDDLVLPPVTLQQVREVANAARNTHIVYYRWQFQERFSEGRGLKVMFNGASGTGKTMTAGVIARDLGLDLFKVDLSGVVSKYIGETEKNLDQLFDAALAANGILFFDEADALFGKRSEVKDAHDRYANIESAYLLQKMETHEGTVILATNLGNNIDEAFSRRLHYVVEFPLPDELHRERLWRGMFPPGAPLGKDVDFKFLGRQFAIAGGEIRNAALQAAFLAAQDGKQIKMIHLMQAMARLMIKQGRLPSPQDFGKYYEKVL